MNTEICKRLQKTSNEVFAGHQETVVADTVLQMRRSATVGISSIVFWLREIYLV
jgi:hypothetical protein